MDEHGEDDGVEGAGITGGGGGGIEGGGYPRPYRR